MEGFIDITEQKKSQDAQNKLLEEVKKVNNELKDFAYIVSHDLKTPLRGVETIANWLAEKYADKLDEDGSDFLDLLAQRAQKMEKLIDGILRYSRADRAEEEKNTIDINELVADTIDILSTNESTAVKIETTLPTCSCRATQITQVFQNLISNAVKYHG